MIDVSWGHLVVIAVVALIVIGPKELPTVLRTAGHWMGKIRRMAGEFQAQFQEALREAEMGDLKRHFDDISSAAKDMQNFDPVATVRKEVETAAADNAGSGSHAGADASAVGPEPVSQVAAPVPGATPASVSENELAPAPQPPSPQPAEGRAE